MNYFNKPYPKVTALCLTALRPNLLERIIGFFLAQDYPNKQLIIVQNSIDTYHIENLNDNPDVKLINCPREYFQTMREMYQKGLEIVKDIADDTDLIVFWEDDDIYLGNYISTCFNRGWLSPQNNYIAYKPMNVIAVLSSDTEEYIFDIAPNNAHESSIMFDYKWIKDIGFICEKEGDEAHKISKEEFCDPHANWRSHVEFNHTVMLHDYCNPYIFGYSWQYHDIAHLSTGFGGFYQLNNIYNKILFKAPEEIKIVPWTQEKVRELYDKFDAFIALHPIPPIS
jgi:hypothetical protein